MGGCLYLGWPVRIANSDDFEILCLRVLLYISLMSAQSA
jgi:hypothetical protein